MRRAGAALGGTHAALADAAEGRAESLAGGATADAGGVRLAGLRAVLDPSGALFCPEAATLVASDLHLETGSSYARGRTFLPPYDSFVTLARLVEVAARWRPARIVLLGDSFHDPFGAERLAPALVDALGALAEQASLVWITGNHDGACAAGLPGVVADALTIGGATFRHIPLARLADGETEVAGHLHPSARIASRGRSIRRRCFVGCRRRLVLPAFGAYTGGLNVADEAFRPLWPRLHDAQVFMIGRAAIYPIPTGRLLPG